MSLVYLPEGFDSLESYLCSLEREEDCSEANCLDGKQSDTLNGTHTASKSSKPESKTDTSTKPQSSETSGNSLRRDMRKPTLDTSMSSVQAFRNCASRSVSQESKEAKTTSETCGLTPFASYRKSNPNLSFSKMSLASCQQNPVLAYAAGLIDGEGHIGIQASKNRSSFYPEVTIGMTVKARTLLEQMQKEFGGTLREGRQATEKWAGTIVWHIGGVAVYGFLKSIQPYAMLKREQIATVLELEKIYVGLEKHQGQKRKWTDKARKAAQALKQRIHLLNKKGPFAQDVEGGWYLPMPDLFGTWERYSEAFPKAGMMLDGELYLRPTWELPISAKGSGYWGTPRNCTSMSAEINESRANHSFPNLETQVAKTLWPTPRAQEKSQYNSQDNGMSLSRKVKTWRTPDAGTNNNVANPCRKLLNGETHGSGGHPIQIRLVDQVMQSILKFPTPSTVDGGSYFNKSKSDGAANRPTLGAMAKYDLWPTPTKQDAENNNPPSQQHRNTPPLNTQVFWPTPHAGTREGQASGGHAGLASSAHQRAKLKDMAGDEGRKMATQALNPDWVEWLMGFPIGWSDVEPFTQYDFMEEGNIEFWEKNIEVWWLGDPADVNVIPRTTDQKLNRVNRLKSLGNGQVPLCMVVAWNILTEDLWVH